MRENDDIIESKDMDSKKLENTASVEEINDEKEKNIEDNKKEDSVSRKGFIGTFFSSGGFFREWIVPIVAAIGIAFLINRFVVYNVYIPSESMVPTLNVGDKLMVTRIYDTSKIKRGDIIVFYSDELSETLIKRVIGLPGDHIVIHNGIVNVNGQDLKEDYVKNNENFSGVYDVPKGKFFFLGDNRKNSYDSRKWINPYIDASNIQGQARFRFYPFQSFGVLH